MKKRLLINGIAEWGRMHSYWSENPPTEIGWYPSLKCYDAEEGTFPYAVYYDGTTKSAQYVVMWGKGPLSTEISAEAIAYANDPDGG